MWLRVTLDDTYTVRDRRSRDGRLPVDGCPGGEAQMKSLIGLRIGRGWNSEVNRRIGGALVARICANAGTDRDHGYARHWRGVADARSPSANACLTRAVVGQNPTRTIVRSSSRASARAMR